MCVASTYMNTDMLILVSLICLTGQAGLAQTGSENGTASLNYPDGCDNFMSPTGTLPCTIPDTNDTNQTVCIYSG